jgi:transposase
MTSAPDGLLQAAVALAPAAYAPELNPAEGIWSLLKRAMANFAAPGLDHLVRIVKRKLKKIQYRPHLITGCLTATGLTIEAS